MWHDIFMDLVNNGDDDETLEPMWRQFKHGRIEMKHFKEANVEVFKKWVAARKSSSAEMIKCDMCDYNCCSETITKARRSKKHKKHL